MTASFKKAIDLHRSGDLDKAKEVYNLILKKKPNISDVNHNLSIIFASENKIEQAIEYCGKALNANKCSEQYWVTYITLLQRIGLSNDEINKHYATAQSFLVSHLKLNEARETLFQETIEIDTVQDVSQPNTQKLSLEQKIKNYKRLLKDEKFSDAEVLLEHLMHQYPNNRAVRKLYSKRQQKSASLKLMLDDVSKRHIISLINNAQWTEAITFIEQFQLKNSWLLYSLRAIAYENLGDVDLAISDLRNAIEIDPTKASLKNNLGNVFLKKGDISSAKVYYQNAIELEPNLFPAYNNLGNCFVQEGNKKASVKYFEKALEIKPDFAEALINLANVQRDLGNLSDALQLYNVALSVTPKSENALLGLGLLLRKSALYDDAIATFDKVLTTNPKSHLALANKASCYLDIGSIKSARDIYDNLIANGFNQPNIFWNKHGTARNIVDAISILRNIIDNENTQLAHMITLHGLLKIAGEDNDYHDFVFLKNTQHPFTRSFEWYFRQSNKPPIFFNRYDLFDHVIKLSNRDRCFYEFGVWRGTAFKYVNPHYSRGYGFDTFTGIPENWHDEVKGTYSSDNVIPSIENAEFVQGEFEKTLPVFFKNERPLAGLINFDADLYSSTICALNNSSDVIDEETILVFDEYLINDHWEEDEHKALHEYCVENNLEINVIAVSFFTKQVAVTLKAK